MVSRPMFRAELVHVDRFVSRAGLELGRELESALIATDGRANGESAALLAGRLDSAALAALLRKQGRAEIRLGATPCWVLPAGVPPAGRPASPETLVALPAPGTALVGTREWVRAALESLAGGGAKAPLPAPLPSLLARVDERATLWTVAGRGAVAGMMRAELDRSPLEQDDLDSVRSLVASFTITDVLKIDSEAGTASPQDAEVLAATIRGIAAVSGLQASMNDPELAAALRTLKVDRTAGGVRMRAEVPAAVAARL